MKILVTGFNPFHNLKINTTMPIIEQLINHSDFDLQSEILRTEFDFVIQKIPEILEKLKPDVYVALGTSSRTNVIQIERFAVNLKDCIYADNTGSKPKEEKIFLDAPTAYQNPISMIPLVEALAQKKIPAEISNTAGTFVCNTAMFTALHFINTHGLKTRYAFLHLPVLPKENNVYTMSFSDIYQGVSAVLDWLSTFE